MFEPAVGEEMVTEARKSVGFPHEGQNFFEESLQILQQLVQVSLSTMVKVKPKKRT